MGKNITIQQMPEKNVRIAINYNSFYYKDRKNKITLE